MPVNQYEDYSDWDVGETLPPCNVPSQFTAMAMGMIVTIKERWGAQRGDPAMQFQIATDLANDGTWSALVLGTLIAAATGLRIGLTGVYVQTAGGVSSASAINMLSEELESMFKRRMPLQRFKDYPLPTYKAGVSWTAADGAQLRHLVENSDPNDMKWAWIAYQLGRKSDPVKSRWNEIRNRR